jgi:LysM domain
MTEAVSGQGGVGASSGSSEAGAPPFDPNKYADAAKDSGTQQPATSGSTQTVTVKPGDTLSGIAHSHHVSMQSLYKANPQFDPSRADGRVQSHRTGQSGWDPDYLRVGQKINLPSQPAAAKPATKPASAATATPAAVPPQQQAQTIVTNAQKQSDPVKALQALNDGYGKAPQAVQDALQHDPGATRIIDNAANWANAPLQTKDGATLPQGRSLQAVSRLDQATKGLDKNLAGMVVNHAASGYAQFAKENQNALPGGSPFGPEGTTELMNLGSRIAGSQQGDQALSKLAGLGGWNTDAVRNAIAGGDDPAYAIAFGQSMKAQGADPSIVTQTIDEGMQERDQSKIANGASLQPTIDVANRMQAAGLDGSGVLKVATDGAQQFKGKIGNDVKALASHDAELAYLVKTDGSGMSPQQLNNAVAAYEKGKGSAWQAQDTKLRQQITKDGSELINQMTELNQLPPALSKSQGSADATLKTIANDPSAGVAITSALQNDPSLVQGSKVAPIVNVFTAAKIGDIGRKFTNEMASSWLRQNVTSKLTNVDLKDPAQVAQATKAIQGIGNENFAKMIGVSKSDLDKAVGQVEQSAGKIAAADTPEAANAALQELDNKLNNDSTLSKAFNKTTLPGQMMRGVGLAFAGAGLINSYQKFKSDPSDPQNGIALLASSAGFAQKNSELLVGLGAVDKDSAIGQFGGEWKLAGKASAGDLIGGVSAVLDGVSAVRSGFGLGTQQDTGKAVFSATTAVGGGLAVAPAFGAAAWLGPVGLGITAVGTIGSAIYSAHESAHQYEGASQAFLEAGGYDSAAAGALSKRDGLISGAAGASQMPFLTKYAQMKHMSPDQLQSWVNSLSPSQVQSLSNRLLQTAGDSGGDPKDFTNGPPQKTFVGAETGFPVEVTKANTMGVFDGYLNYDHVPHP